MSSDVFLHDFPYFLLSSAQSSCESFLCCSSSVRKSYMMVRTSVTIFLASAKNFHKLAFPSQESMLLPSKLIRSSFGSQNIRLR